MQLLSFLGSFISFLCPYRSDTFYRHYIATVRSVQANDSTVLRQFKLHTCICVYVSLHLLYLWFANLPPAQRLIHFDFYFYMVKGELNWMAVHAFASCVYFAYKLYFTPSETNNGLLLGLLEERDSSFFLYSKTEKRTFIDEVIETKMKLAFNLMQSVLVIFGKLLSCAC